MRRLWLVLAMVAAVTLVGCSSARETTVGDAAIESDWTMPDAVTVNTFEVPTGTVTVLIGQPITDDVRISSDRENLVAAPEDGALLPVELDFRPVTGRRGTDTEPALPVAAALILDGRSYTLPNPYEVVDGEVEYESSIYGWYLPVADDPAERMVTMSYDGLTQSVDLNTGTRDAGAADLWYARQRIVESECPTSGWTGELANIIDGNCFSTAALVVPYFADLGWAAPGHRWLVMYTALNPELAGPGLDDSGLTTDGLEPYNVDLDSVTITVDGAEPVGSAGTSGAFAYNETPDPEGYQIFDVDTGPAAVAISAGLSVDYLPVNEGGEATIETGDIALAFDLTVP